MITCGIILLFLLNFGLTSTAEEFTDLEGGRPVALTFKGSGPADTQTFTVDDGWQVEWKTTSPGFKLSAHGSSKRPYIGAMNERDVILQQFETQHPILLANTTEITGTAFHPWGGTFYLRVMANGLWTITLHTIKDTKDYLDVPYTGAP